MYWPDPSPWPAISPGDCGDRIFSRILPPAGRGCRAAALMIAFLFAPLRNKMQGLLDRAFYRQTFDYRDSCWNLPALLLEISLDRLGRRFWPDQDTLEVPGASSFLESQRATSFR